MESKCRMVKNSSPGCHEYVIEFFFFFKKKDDMKMEGMRT